jgi:hypothetical protein
MSAALDPGALPRPAVQPRRAALAGSPRGSLRARYLNTLRADIGIDCKISR